MFERSEMDAELHARLKAAGLNPLDPAVRAINDVVSAYYAEKDRQGAEPSSGVLSRLTALRADAPSGVALLAQSHVQRLVRPI